MKLKNDFVTNSSSTSFIMYVRTKDKTMEDFLNRFKDCVHRVSYHDCDNAEFEEIADGVFSITDWTSMYNNIGDTPEYMKDILVAWYTDRGQLYECGITSVTFKKVDD